MQLKNNLDEIKSTKLVVFGGWNLSTQYQDVWLFDFETTQWEEVDISRSIVQWNCSAIQALSIPNNKLFIFGGSTGNFEENNKRTESKFVNDMYVFDLKSYKGTNNVFQSIGENNVEFVKPRSRESTAMFFEKDDSRLVIFGGWANNWLDDMWVLNVGSITGPSYAIFGIEPKMGPLTGNTDIILTGAGFRDSTNIIVIFTNDKQQHEVEGTYISLNEISCQTPAFERSRDKNAHTLDTTVRISIDKRGENTITSAQFQYYLNTSAQQSIAYGVGLIQSYVGKTQFNIQAKNIDNNNRTSGTDKFVVKIIDKSAQVRYEEEIQEIARMQEEEAKKEEERKLKQAEDEEQEKQMQKQIEAAQKEQQDSKKDDEQKPEGEDKQKQQGEQPAEGEKPDGEQPEGEKPEQPEDQQPENAQEQQNTLKQVDSEEPPKQKEPTTKYIIESEVIDNGDGTYTVKYEVDQPCELDIEIFLQDENGQNQAIKGSGQIKSKFIENPDGKENEMNSAIVSQYLKDQLNEIKKFIEDSTQIIDLRKKKIVHGKKIRKNYRILLDNKNQQTKKENLTNQDLNKQTKQVLIINLKTKLQLDLNLQTKQATKFQNYKNKEMNYIKLTNLSAKSQMDQKIQIKIKQLLKLNNQKKLSNNINQL